MVFRKPVQYNDGYKIIQTVSEQSITLFNDLITEDEELTIIISRVVVPDSLKLYLSKMILYHLKNCLPVDSERFGDYSVSYGKVVGGYPEALMKGLDKYKRVNCK